MIKINAQFTRILFMPAVKKSNKKDHFLYLRKLIKKSTSMKSLILNNFI